MQLIMLGAPGAGKGTQAEILSKKLSIPAISTGAIIREAIKKETPFGKKAKDYIEKGLLLPDDVVIELILNRISENDCKEGFILDGFPRTSGQAKALDDYGIQIDAALSLEVDDDIIVKRLSGRRECSSCRTPYHIESKPPKVEGKCDNCSAPLITRADDVPEVISSRIDVYHQETAPLKEYFEKRGKLIKVVGEDGVEDTAIAVFEALKSLG